MVLIDKFNSENTWKLNKVMRYFKLMNLQTSADINIITLFYYIKQLKCARFASRLIEYGSEGLPHISSPNSKWTEAISDWTVLFRADQLALNYICRLTVSLGYWTNFQYTVQGDYCTRATIGNSLMVNFINKFQMSDLS